MKETRKDGDGSKLSGRTGMTENKGGISGDSGSLIDGISFWCVHINKVKQKMSVDEFLEVWSEEDLSLFVL